MTNLLEQMEEATRQPVPYEGLYGFAQGLTGSGNSREPIASSKLHDGDAVTMKIELEKKYVLDLRQRDAILTTLRLREHSNLIRRDIRQFYEGNGARYRHTTTMYNINTYVLEVKRGIHLGTPYAVSTEDETPITATFFDEKWHASEWRLQKTRYEASLSHGEHRSLMVDFFHTGPDQQIYAIIAEVEMVLDFNTQFLALNNFMPPEYLQQYIVKTVDDSDPASKIFKSINLIDTPDSIARIAGAYDKLYDQSL